MILDIKKQFYTTKEKKLRKYRTLTTDEILSFFSIIKNQSKEELKNKNSEYNETKQRTKNISFDILNIKNYDFYLKPYNYLIKEKDTNEYLFIKRKPLKDISLKQLLKELLFQHKINNFQYKKAIKNLNKGKRINKGVKEKINFYLKTIKKDKENKHISKKRKDKNLFNIEINKNNYQIALKKGMLINDLTKPIIKREIYKRYNAYNKLLFDSEN